MEKIPEYNLCHLKWEMGWKQIINLSYIIGNQKELRIPDRLKIRGSQKFEKLEIQSLENKF